MLRILAELRLVEVDANARTVTLLEAERTQLERSRTFEACGVRLQIGETAMSGPRSALAA
jgi:hypothetical protein